MITPAQALKIISKARPMAPARSVPLLEAIGTVCGQDVTAACSLPPHDVSAMDGYAVRLTDAASAGAKLKVIGEAPAGAPFSGTVGPGETVRIFTGSFLPGGADHIVIQENVTREDDVITLMQDSDAPRHIRKKGIDFLEGDIVVRQGQRIGPPEIALLAASNHAQVPARQRLKVAILANGHELRPPGSTLKPGQIVGSNSAGLSALISAWGGEPIDLGIADDNLESITALIGAAKDADIILPVGGASVGDYDLMKPAFAAKGYETLFSKVAIRPGKPTWLAHKDGQCVLGLPGNPASAYVCAHIFLRPLMGHGDFALTRAHLTAPLPQNGPRETFMRANAFMQDGLLMAKPFPRQDSSLITPLTQSNIFIHCPPGSGPWEAGDLIGVTATGLGPAPF